LSCKEQLPEYFLLFCFRSKFASQNFLCSVYVIPLQHKTVLFAGLVRLDHHNGIDCFDPRWEMTPRVFPRNSDTWPHQGFRTKVSQHFDYLLDAYGTNGLLARGYAVAKPLKHFNWSYNKICCFEIFVQD